MAYSNGKDVKKIDEFELVDNSNNKNNVYKIAVFEKEPVLNKTKTNYDFVLYDQNRNVIGKKYSNGDLEIFPEYKEKIKKIEGVDLDSKKIIIKDDDSSNTRNMEREEQERQLENTRRIEEQNRQLKKEKDEEKNKIQSNNVPVGHMENDNSEIKVSSSSTKITHQDLINNPKYKDVTSWTRIDDQTFTDAVNPTTKDGTQIDKNSIIVAEIGGDFKVLAKAMGTDEIIDLSKDARENNTVKGQSNRIQGNVENDTGRHCTMQIPMFNNKEIVINQTPSGRIDLQQIDYSSGNDDKALPIGTDYMHPTEEELNRAKQEQEGIVYNDVIMTREEIEANLAGENEFVYNYVMDKVNGTSENPTNERFNEILDEAHEEDQEKNLNNDDNEKSLDNDALERRERRFRKPQ